jgi:pyrroline-5-carboxylate reductase
MNKIGIIGCGSMGSMLVKRFLASNVIAADQVIVTSLPLDKDRLEELEMKYPGLEIAPGNRELAKQSKMIFVCVKPLEVKGVIEEITGCLGHGVHMVSIAASVSIRNIESIFPGKISRVVPSITSTLDSGISLVCHNKRVEKEDAQYLETLLNAVSSVKTIDEAIINVATNLTSTAPGLIAAIFRDFVESGMKSCHFSKEEVEELVVATFHRMTALFHEKIIYLHDNDARLQKKWRQTEEGEHFLKENLPSIFDDLFDKTLGKFAELEVEVTSQFKNAQQEPAPAP